MDTKTLKKISVRLVIILVLLLIIYLIAKQ
jgi:hypothetical protein